MNAKDEQVLKELMQLGYDFNVILSTTMRPYPEVEEQLHGLAEKFMYELFDWLTDNGKEYTEDHKKITSMRFCMTIGIGVAWMLRHNEEKLDVDTIYERLKAPRTIYEMDEYIEDVVGIWFSSQSLQHYMLLKHFNRCYKIVHKNYNLDSYQDRIAAANVMMVYGICFERTRQAKAETVTSYKGEMPWHWEVWDAIYGPGGGEHLDEYNYWAVKAYNDGDHILKTFVLKKDENEEFAVKDSYYWSNSLNEDAGIKVIAEDTDEKVNLLTAFPVFDSKRVFLMVLDEVQVWDNGAEATLIVHSAEDEDFRITFYDTNYLENKDKYIKGHAYIFDIYGIAYHIGVVPEEERSLKLEGDKAVNFNKKLGQDTELDEQGNPEPVNISLAQMHSLMQLKDNMPEDASFRAPVNAVYDDIDFFGKKVHEIEITSPYRDFESEKEHKISIYSTAEGSNGFAERPEVGTPIKGVVYFQGQMKHAINPDERPSKILHSFDATEKNGDKKVFTYNCEAQEAGQPMSQEECENFAKEVFYEHFASSLNLHAYKKDDNPDFPDFNAKRNRDFWIKPDVNYQASSLFESEDVTNGIYRHYSTNRLTVMAYITLYDENGNQCQWLKGHSYTAKFHYGSMTPGIKMEIMPPCTHEELVEILYESFKNLNIRQLMRYMHKDLDYRSGAIDDPIISREEYMFRTNWVIGEIKKEADGYFKPTLVHDSDQGATIKLEYSSGVIDEVKVETKDSQIIAINVINVKAKE